MIFCDYCTGPLVRTPLRGRPWPDQPASDYCCYGCLSLGEQTRAEFHHPPSDRPRLDWRLALSVFLAGQSMTFSLAINWTPPPPSVAFVIQGLLGLTALLVVALLGWPLLRQAIDEVKQHRVSIEGLFLLSLVGAMAASVQSWVRGQGPIYFEITAILLVVYTVGRQLSAANKARALHATKAWETGLSRCRLVDAREIAVTEIVPGDVVEVRPGEMIAVDGDIVQGTAFVSEATRTGEPFAVVRRPGDHIYAGSINQDALLRVKATTPGTQRQIDSLFAAVESARQSATNLQGQADRAAVVLLPLIVVIALGTFAVWTFYTDWQTGLMNGLSVLLVACPCALGLATPIVMWSSLGRLAERGLVSRDGSLIERLAEVDRVVFDKTGTLTEERYRLVDVVTNDAVADRKVILSIIGTIEKHSDHPLARAFDSLPVDETFRIDTLQVIPGCGLEIHGSRHVRIGSVVGQDSDPVIASHDRIGILSHDRRITVEIDGQLAAVAFVAERLRDSTTDALADMRQLNLPVEILTGDTVSVLDAPATTGLLPEQKQQRIAAMNRPLFVGDGINDAPALAAAHVGIALASGTDLAVHTSTATLYGGDLRVIPWAIVLSRQAIKTVRLTLAWAVVYNLIGITLAACGVLHPLVAAVLMTLSSLGVAWFASRINRVVLHPSTNQSSSWPLLLQSATHGICIVAQGLLLVQLLGWTGIAVWLVPLIAAILAALVVWSWATGPQLPHWLDMNLAMLTLGNAGMLAGWWADHGFGPITKECCACTEPHRSLWMWLGMLLCGNVAMLCLPRQACPGNRWVRLAVENVGMALGMALGGWVVQLADGNATAHLLGMITGMMLGMNVLTPITPWERVS